MSFLKNVGEKAKEAASAAANKSQDMVEVGKIKVKISNLEGDVKKLKAKIGDATYTAYSQGKEMPLDEIEKMHKEIDDKLGMIQALNEEVESI